MPQPAPLAGLDGPPEMSRARRFGILALCSVGLLMVTLDVTVVNVALPSIGRTLHAPVSGLQWTIDAYTVVIGSLLMLAGSTADRIGRRRTFTIGLAVFSVASLLCSLAPSLPLLVTFRALQAIGGSMLAPVAMSIIANTFTDRRERAQAIGIWGSVNGMSLALGPVVGGLLVSSIGWRSVFWINVPVGLGSIGLAVRYLPESRAARARRPDLVGQLLVIVLLASLTTGIIEAPGRGLFSPTVVTAAVLALASLAGIVVYEPRRDDPLIELRFFRSVPFASATVIAVAVFAAMGGLLFMITLYLQESRGLSALAAGLDLLPLAVMTMGLAPLSGRIVGSRGTRGPLVVAGAALLASGVMLSGLSTTTPYIWLFASFVIFGTAYGLANTPISNTAVSGMPREQAGVAAAIASTSRQVGAALGVAVSGAIVASAVAGHRALAGRLPSATHPAWWLVAGCGALVLTLGLVSTSAWARRTAARTAHELNPEAIEEGPADLVAFE